MPALPGGAGDFPAQTALFFLQAKEPPRLCAMEQLIKVFFILKTPEFKDREGRAGQKDIFLLNTKHKFLLLSPKGKSWERGSWCSKLSATSRYSRHPAAVASAQGGADQSPGAAEFGCLTAFYRARKPVHEAGLLPLGLTSWDRRNPFILGKACHRQSTDTQGKLRLAPCLS